MESLRRILKVLRGATGPKGDFQYFPEGHHKYPRELPRGFIHHDTQEAFPQIFILTYVLDQFSCT